MVVSRSKINSDEMDTFGLHILSRNGISLAIFHRDSWAKKLAEGISDPLDLFHESIGDLAIVQYCPVTRRHLHESDASGTHYGHGMTDPTLLLIPACPNCLPCTFRYEHLCASIAGSPQSAFPAGVCTTAN